jgi:hypothetical protein
MITRAILLTGWLFVGEGLKSGTLFLSLQLPYLSGTYRKRAFVTDVIMTLMIAIIILLAT